jgi:ATP-dependent Clp protease ATP-binding subunit ClpA
MISTALDDGRVGGPVRRRMTPIPEPEPAGQPGDPRGKPCLAPLVGALEAAPDPGTALQRIAALRERVDEVEREQVIAALGEGASLAAVGRDLGISRQAVHRRYGDLHIAAPSHRSRRRETAAVSAAGVKLTSEARLVLRHALAEAEAAGDPALGGEHVLLALLRPPALPALAHAGVALERARSHVLAASTGSRVFAREGERPDVRPYLRAATTTALERGRDRITPELLLLSALTDADSAAARTLRAVGADPAAVVAAVSGDTPSPEEAP